MNRYAKDPSSFENCVWNTIIFGKEQLDADFYKF